MPLQPGPAFFQQAVQRFALVDKQAEIALQFGLLQASDDAVSQEQRIAQGLEGQCVARHALDHVEVGIAAAGEHQLVETQRSGAFAEIVDLASSHVDVGDARHADVAAVNHLSMRCDDVTRQDGRAHHFRQQRIERDEVVLADERQRPIGR